jgi:hypothetical protein
MDQFPEKCPRKDASLTHRFGKRLVLIAGGLPAKSRQTTRNIVGAGTKFSNFCSL